MPTSAMLALREMLDKAKEREMEPLQEQLVRIIELISNLDARLDAIETKYHEPSEK